MSTTPQISVSDFSHQILDKVIYFRVIRLEESMFVWVGSRPVLSNMAVALPAKYGAHPTSTALFGVKTEHTSESLAKRLDMVRIQTGGTYNEGPEYQLTGFRFRLTLVDCRVGVASDDDDDNDAKRLNKQVFVSCSVPYDPELSMLMERQLAVELGKMGN